MQFEYSRQSPKYISLDRVTFPTIYIYLFLHFFVAVNQKGKNMNFEQNL
jgi:hypothetical protein